MIALGIDPGAAICGYGVVKEEGDGLQAVDFGVITTQGHDPLPTRLQQIYQGILDLIARHGPQEVAVEELFFARNARTALAVGQARGVALLAAANSRLPVAEYTPLQVKQALVGYGRADKEQVQQMVRLILGLKQMPQPDDAADALAVAICHLHWRQVSQRLA